MKASFETVDSQIDILYNISHIFARPAEVFSAMWKVYLDSVEWTEEEYEQQSERQIFNKE